MAEYTGQARLSLRGLVGQPCIAPGPAPAAERDPVLVRRTGRDKTRKVAVPFSASGPACW